MRLIDADEFERRIKKYDTTDYADKALYNFAHNEMITMPTVCDIEQIRAEIQKVLDAERDFTSENAKAQALALMWVLELIDKYAEQERTDEWQNGYDRGWEEAEVFYEKEEPTIPCELCGFNTGGFCEYLSVCPAIGKAVSK